MSPIAFEIGSLQIRWYGIMAAIGFLIGSWLLERNRKYADLSKEQCQTLIMIALFAGIIGARIYFVIKEFDTRFRHDLSGIIRVDQGGLVFYGGFILAIIAIVIYIKKQHLHLWKVLDVFTPVIAAGHGAGRIGCYLNGCCYGKETILAWGVKHPFADAMVHPVQLLEAGENFLLCAVYFYLLRRIKKPGVLTALYFIVYGTLRFLNEFLRGDNEPLAKSWRWLQNFPDFTHNFTEAQWIGLLLVPFGIGLLIYCLKRDGKN